MACVVVVLYSFGRGRDESRTEALRLILGKLFNGQSCQFGIGWPEE